MLVTGGSGYIASRLIRRLQRDGVDVRVLSRRAPAIAIPVQWFQGHAADEALLADAMRGVRSVFHLAGQTSVAVARQNPESDYDANVVGMIRLLDAVRRHAPSAPLVFAGTVTQAGIPSGEVLDERAADHPITIYDRHKLEAERILEAACRAGALRGVTLRLANIYGPGAQSTAADRGVLNRMIRAASTGQPLTIFGDGTQLRDYTFIDDVVEAFVKAAQCAADMTGRHFVVGSGRRMTFAEIVATVARRSALRIGGPIAINYVPAPATSDPIDARSYVVDAGALASATGWQPLIDLETGIDRSLDWLAQTGEPARRT